MEDSLILRRTMAPADHNTHLVITAGTGYHQSKASIVNWTIDKKAVLMKLVVLESEKVELT